jgi:ABC-type uncharacterized transport system permease subunit
MKFKDLFNDKNDINEKSVIGFLAFIIMTVFAIADIVTGYLGKDLVVNEFIFNAFLVLVLGTFGISGVEKIMNRKTEAIKTKN